MPRRGRASSPPPARRRSPAPAPTQAPVVHRAPPAQVAAPMAASQGPSLMGQMAATAGGVALGSVAGHAITGMFSGNSDSQQSAPAQAAAPAAAPHAPESGGACAWEIKQFLQCAQGQSDLTLCEGFNEAIRQCKAQNGI